MTSSPGRFAVAFAIFRSRHSTSSETPALMLPTFPCYSVRHSHDECYGKQTIAGVASRRGLSGDNISTGIARAAGVVLRSIDGKASQDGLRCACPLDP